jgi:uncharacterized protein
VTPAKPAKSTRIPARITIRLQPRASRDEVLGWQAKDDPDQQDVLRVRVKAAPVDGAANAALIQLMAKYLGVPKNRVLLVSGATARNKILEIEGVSSVELKSRVNRL